MPLTEFALTTGLERIVTIYVGNLSFQATEEDLREVFAGYGAVSRVSLPTDRETGRKRGFAFVEMEDETQEDAAIAELDGAEWLGRELKVNKAKPREPRSGNGAPSKTFTKARS
jgi:RNA recognition motif-containing protein